MPYMEEHILYLSCYVWVHSTTPDNSILSLFSLTKYMYTVMCVDTPNNTEIIYHGNRMLRSHAIVCDVYMNAIIHTCTAVTNDVNSVVVQC